MISARELLSSVTVGKQRVAEGDDGMAGIEPRRSSHAVERLTTSCGCRVQAPVRS